VPSGQGSTQAVVVRGLLDGHPSEAHWVAGTLIAEPELLRRAEVVVAMEERFTHDGTRAVVTASLHGDPAAAALTLMRALTKVTSVELTSQELDLTIGELARVPQRREAAPEES
jgi:hypothetical protein